MISTSNDLIYDGQNKIKAIFQFQSYFRYVVVVVVADTQPRSRSLSGLKIMEPLAYAF